MDVGFSILPDVKGRAESHSSRWNLCQRSAYWAVVGLVPPYLVVAQGVAARHGADNPELPSIVGTILPAD